ncbi:MAG: hypothetical protein QXS50_00150 [Candidatus Caldarchaeum sp.]
MKLSSAPPRWAFTSVIAAAMTYGPTRIPRIAYELDMPVETCRYYLNKFHESGFRFRPVVDYRALGLSPHIAFIRFSNRLDLSKQVNFLKWLDSLYVVYRATLVKQREYFLEVVPPSEESQNYQKILQTLQEAEVLENYAYDEVVDGYYKPEWVKLYDFKLDSWSRKVEVEIPRIPLSMNRRRVKFDKTDLLIIEELELEPTTKMNKISEMHEISPQLVSYHRERHIEGGRIITGYLPTRRTKFDNVRYVLVNTVERRVEGFEDYLHAVWMKKQGTITRLHVPVHAELEMSQTSYPIFPDEVFTFTVPTEHYGEKGWASTKPYLEQLENLIKTT